VLIKYTEFVFISSIISDISPLLQFFSFEMQIEMGIEALDFLARFVGPSIWIGIRGVKFVVLVFSNISSK
jgi:hypothetical protein